MSLLLPFALYPQINFLFQSLGAGKFDDLEPELPDDEDIDDVNDETFGAGAVCK